MRDNRSRDNESRLYFSIVNGTPIAMSVKRWTAAAAADLTVSSLSPALGGDLFNRKHDSIAHSLSLSPTHRSDMTEILLKGC